MIWKDIKIGDRIKILKMPNMWDSHFSKLNSLDLIYPWEGVVENIQFLSEYQFPGLISGYGFSMMNITDFKIIPNQYEIY